MGLIKISIGMACLSSVLSSAAAVAMMDLSDLVGLVSPSVVSVQSTSFVTEKNAAYSRYLDQFILAPQSKKKVDLKSPSQQKQIALGSGFVVLKGEGKSQSQGVELQEVYILTNHHVIEGAKDIEVLIAGSSFRFESRVVGSDSVSDVAVLIARLPIDIRALPLADSTKIKVGEGVFAIGNPFGLGHTVTSGIISAKDRSLGIGRIDRYLQTDAAINFGNSGGPLFNKVGEVIGMNTLVRADAHGIGFAIPSDTLKKLIPSLQKGQKPARSWLGLSVERLSPALANFYKVNASDFASSRTGVLITHVFSGSPAASINLQEGDFVSSYLKDGEQRPLQSPWELKDWIESMPPGQEVELIVYRNGKKLLAKMKVAPLNTQPETSEVDYYEIY